MQPVIGVTSGEVLNNNEAWAPSVYGQAHTYTNAIARAGGAPIILPIVQDETTLRRLYELCAAILFSGGNDIDPLLYGARPLPLTQNISRRRDSQELQLLKWALAEEKPVLAICRGMQLLNVAHGGSLYQDIATEVPAAKDHKKSEHAQSFDHIAHILTISPTSRLAKILETLQIPANALHHQAVRQLGSGLVATAWSEDDIVEAIELPTKQQFVVGVQSHPEALEARVEPRWQKLFQAFVGHAT